VIGVAYIPEHWGLTGIGRVRSPARQLRPVVATLYAPNGRTLRVGVVRGDPGAAPPEAIFRTAGYDVLLVVHGQRWTVNPERA
jgi:hypothetical protein